MTAKEVGRNDPCPCGSGKKYKYCCLRKNRRRRRAGRASSAARPKQRFQDQLSQIRHLVQQLMPHLRSDEAEGLQEDLEKVEEIARYEAMQDEIEAAGQTLEAHRAEFQELMVDPQAAMNRARRLFSEERFAPMRYSVDDLDRAFKAVGYPSRFLEEPGEEEMETLVAATVYLAGDEDNRFHLARQLMMALPGYVDAGRYLDAWLIQYSALRVTEVLEESNPFCGHSEGLPARPGRGWRARSGRVGSRRADFRAA